MAADDDEKALFEDLFALSKWGSREFEHVAGMYSHVCGKDFKMTLESFESVMNAGPSTKVTVYSKEDLASIFHAFDLKSAGYLTLDHFLMGVCAMCPSTPHRDQWLVHRSSCIYRMYARSTVMDFDTFTRVVTAAAHSNGRTLSGKDAVIEAQSLFSCEHVLSEDAFIFCMGTKLRKMLRLPDDHPLLSCI